MTRVQLKRSAKGERRLRVVAKVGGRKRYTKHDAAAALVERVKLSTQELADGGDVLQSFRTKIHACLDATPILELDKQDRIVKAAAGLNGALMAEARLRCSRADVERVIGTLALAIEEDVEPLVAIEQAQEAFKVVAAAETQKYVAAVRLLERVRSSTLELRASGDVEKAFSKKIDRAFDAHPGLSIEAIRSRDRMEMGAYVLREAAAIHALLECSKACLDAVYGLCAIALEDDIKPLVVLEQFQEAFEVLSCSPKFEDRHMDLWAFCCLHSPLVSRLLSLECFPPNWRAR